ncbi:hypothetical protein HWV62_21640 [Athelia sp. TMB]|nr:hypothetical protein HWV62_21640 [Athelia sp. TMB]
MSYVSVMRPKETIKIETKPGFRHIHEIIEHVGIVTRLECWRLYFARQDSRFATLEDLAESKPQWEELERMAVRLVQEEVASFNTFSDLRAQPADVCNEERENMLLWQQQFLLYEAMMYALNKGNIRRVEDGFMPWVFTFKGCEGLKYIQKHKALEVVPGRRSAYSVPDTAAQGMHLMLMDGQHMDVSGDGEGDEILDEEEQDIEQEVGDDGGLDV